jgi:DNA (cytosine-5)-methyltransferase 1
MFSGIGGFDLALRNQGHEIIGACEIDKYARSVYAKQFPGVPIHNDATNLHAQSLPHFDVLCAGFPCQAFSIAGKRRGFEDTRGSLFFEIARVAKEKKPPYLILENVKGLLSHDKGQTFRTIIHTLDEMGYDAEWQVLNSKYFVPQNRERVFIIGHLRGQRTRQIFPIGNHDTEIKRNGIKYMIKSKTQSDRVYRINGIGPSLGIGAAMSKPLIGITIPVLTPDRIKKINEEKKLKRIGGYSQCSAVYDINGLAPTLSACTHGYAIGNIAIPVLTPDRIKKRQNGRRFKTNGEESFTLTAQDKHGIFDGTRIRRLTPLECERLQGFPDNWTKGISDTQRYKCVGNAVTVPVVEFIVKELFN